MSTTLRKHPDRRRFFFKLWCFQNLNKFQTKKDFSQLGIRQIQITHYEYGAYKRQIQFHSIRNRKLTPCNHSIFDLKCVTLLFLIAETESLKLSTNVFLVLQSTLVIESRVL